MVKHIDIFKNTLIDICVFFFVKLDTKRGIHKIIILIINHEIFNVWMGFLWYSALNIIIMRFG